MPSGSSVSSPSAVNANEGLGDPKGTERALPERVVSLDKAMAQSSTPSRVVLLAALARARRCEMC